MSNTARLTDKVTERFLNYLQELGISKNTLKFYKSDLNHFAGWLILRTKQCGSFVENLEDAIPYITGKIATEYKIYLNENLIPHKTVNRRLSTLRHLSRFLSEVQMLDFNFMDGVGNNLKAGPVAKKSASTPLLESFVKHLEFQKVSRNTVKNYQSDIKHFLAWVESNKT